MWPMVIIHQFVHSYKKASISFLSQCSFLENWSTRPTTVVIIIFTQSVQATFTARRVCGMAEWIIDDIVYILH